MSGKHDDKLTSEINKFWREKHYPPTVRDLAKRCKISSTSVVAYVIRRLPGFRVSERGRIIPEWVDKALSGGPHA